MSLRDRGKKMQGLNLLSCGRNDIYAEKGRWPTRRGNNLRKVPHLKKRLVCSRLEMYYKIDHFMRTVGEWLESRFTGKFKKAHLFTIS